MPRIGSEEHVELDAVGPLVWSAGAQVVALDGASEHGQAATGVVEDIEGSAVVLRVGGSVVLLEVDGEPPLGVVGATVTLRPVAFELSPTGI